MRILFIIILFYYIFVRSIYAQSKILINEFLIDPQPQSVEIFNSGTESADISDWIIDDSGGTTFYTIPKESILFPNQCLIFSADFNLNKFSTDMIKLINNSQQLIDSFSYKSSSGSGISYLRLPDGTNNWTTASANFGFYNTDTEQACLFPTLTPTFTPTQTPIPTILPTSTIIPTIGTGNPPPTEPISQSYDNIYLSEIMVNPVSGEKEWVEIYNDNDFFVSLSNWFIDDLENAGSSPKVFSLEISGKSYAVIELTSSMFNNDGDSVRLLDFNKNSKDDFEYQKTEQGRTLGRTGIDSDDFCFQEPSKNYANSPCINPSSTSIAPSPTVKIILSSIINNPPSKTPITKTNNFDVSIRRSINYPTGIVQKNYDNGDVLGLTNELIINPSDYKYLINLLCFLSFSYSLLTICSILFRMKLSYGKNKNFYSSSFHSA